ncbi:hypothetical protein HNQ94_000844 [Salirhabdus euzebyi]|uniref:Uncharacterized protein n=1 Tax=Salirhabdus euzebyi TaxID=394506 RepID=A0A841PU71_9BACI|nr:hypothetical protein [Salirhabdus euzebyi]MBB6452399.1 hypothetical protein [Salirhabdus euzebyi]
MSYKEYWERIFDNNDKFNSLVDSYWQEYSSFGNWQFWVVVFLMVFPLLLLIFMVDRKRIFELFFFGYTVHILWTYIDIILERHNYLVHTYFLLPQLPFALNLTASTLPVGFLLVYQYCTEKKKNFYLYTVILSAIFTFGFATIESYLGLVEFRKGMNQFFLFLLDLGIVLVSFWFTRILLKIKER